MKRLGELFIFGFLLRVFSLSLHCFYCLTWPEGCSARGSVGRAYQLFYTNPWHGLNFVLRIVSFWKKERNQSIVPLFGWGAVYMTTWPYDHHEQPARAGNLTAFRLRVGRFNDFLCANVKPPVWWIESLIGTWLTRVTNRYRIRMLLFTFEPRACERASERAIRPGL